MSCSFFQKFCLAVTVPLCLSASTVQAANVETLTIKKQTSHYMNLGQTITRIAVGNPDIASVVQLPGSTSEFLIVTKTTESSTALFVWTADGVRHEYLIIVSPEDPGRAMLIEQAINLPDVHVKIVGERILLTGTVENQYEKNQALQTARLFVDGSTESSLLVGSGFDMKLDTSTAQSATSGRSEDIELAKSENKGKIIDLIQILHPTQIRLEAQIIEINSEDAKDLGFQYSTSGNAPGIFTFGEDYARTNTAISESYSDSSSTARNGSWSYSGNRSNSYSDSDDYSSNSRDNSFSGNGGRSGNSSSSFSRSVTSTWYDMVQFGNNPLKWIGQHFAPVNVTISALVTKGKARILSRPSVITLSGEQATIQIGGEIPYTTTNSNGWSNTSFKNYGIILQFKPVVDAQGRINSGVHAEVSNISGQSVNGQPIISTRSADSVISLYSGSPIVIGGLMDSSETKNVQKIPLLGDIPILGEFFKYTSKSRDKRELIIVVTPHLVGEEDVSRSPMSEAMRQWYEQEQRYRDAMESFDFNRPVEEFTPDEEEESKPDSTNKPFKK